MTIIRLITNNYLQTLCSLSSSCGETQLDIALQNPLPSPTRIPLLSVSLLLYPTFSPLSLHPDPAFHSICYPCCSVSITSYLLTQPLLFFVPVSFCFSFCARPSILYLWVVITVIFLPFTHFPAKSQHPVYLCTGHGCSPPPLLSLGLSLPERLTIPSASLLIYHPNGGYKREKTTICWGRSSHKRARKVFGLPLSIKSQSFRGLCFSRGDGGAHLKSGNCHLWRHKPLDSPFTRT